jgi:hypothetical protein
MEDPLIPMINVIVNAADARKATSISAFRISSITEITTFMVIVEGMLDSKMSLTLHISEREMIYLYFLTTQTAQPPRPSFPRTRQVTLAPRIKPLH